VSGHIIVECLTAKEAAGFHGLDIDAEFCYVVVSDGFRIDERPDEDALPYRVGVVAQNMVYRHPEEGVVWDRTWAVEFMEAGEPQCRFEIVTLDDALRIAKDYCRTGRGKGVPL